MFSTTVSRTGLGPLGPLEVTFGGGGGCSWIGSSLRPSFKMECSDGVEEGSTTIEGGAGFCVWDKAEFLRERADEGGGDLSRGDGGTKVGVLSPEAGGRGRFWAVSRETASVTELGD